jgi:hypothetical protein
MHKSVTKCNETVGKWCKNKHGASKIIDTLETYHRPSCAVAVAVDLSLERRLEESGGGRNGLKRRELCPTGGSGLKRWEERPTSGPSFWFRRWEGVFVKRKKLEDLFTKPSSPALATGAPGGSSRLARTKFVFGLQVLVPKMFSL